MTVKEAKRLKTGDPIRFVGLRYFISEVSLIEGDASGKPRVEFLLRPRPHGQWLKVNAEFCDLENAK